MDNDRVQLNALDYDLDIDGPNPPPPEDMLTQQ